MENKSVLRSEMPFTSINEYLSEIFERDQLMVKSELSLHGIMFVDTGKE